MVKLISKGVNEIVVLDELKYESTDEFFKDVALGLPPCEIAVGWFDGIVFHYAGFPWNEVTVKEYIDHGRIYWALLMYAPMKEYREKIVEGNVVFQVKKVKNPVLMEVVRELKKKLNQID